MVTSELIEYVRKAREQRLSEDEIHQNLLNEGWVSDDVDKVMSGSGETPLSVAGSTLMPIGDLFEVVFERLRSRLVTVVSIVAVPVLLSHLLTIGLLKYLSFPTESNYTEEFFQEFFRSGEFNVLMSRLLFIVPAVIVFNLLIVIAQAALVCALRKEVVVTWKEAYREALSRIGYYILASFISISIVISGLVLFVLPAFIFSFWFLFVGPIVLLEKKGALTALLKSKWYVSGRFLALAGRYGLYVVASYVISIPFGLFSQIPYAGVLFSAANQAISLALGTAFIVVLYEEIKALKDPDTFQESTGLKISFGLLAVLGLVCVVGLFLILGYGFSRLF